MICLFDWLMRLGGAYVPPPPCPPQWWVVDAETGERAHLLPYASRQAALHFLDFHQAGTSRRLEVIEEA